MPSGTLAGQVSRPGIEPGSGSSERCLCDPLHHRDIQRPDLESNQVQGLRRASCDPLHHRDNSSRADDWIATPSIQFVLKHFHLHLRWRVVDRISVGERLSPQPGTPLVGELLRLCLAGKPSPDRAGLGIDNLKMPQLVEEYVVQQKPPNCRLGPLAPPQRAKLARRRPPMQCPSSG